MRSLIEGRRVVLLDDSVVRGTTSRKIVRMLKDAGAREVHFRVSSPPIVASCYYGIDTPTKAELIAGSYSVERICKYLETTTLGYLSMAGLLRAVDATTETFCVACFSGEYPLPVSAEDRRQLKLFGEEKATPVQEEP